MTQCTDQVLTVAQMRAAEDALIAAGESADSLMLRAGRGAADWVHRLAAGRSVTVLCGPGNNGGDGYVIAQSLHRRGVPVQVVAPLPPRTAAAQAARAACTAPIDDRADGALPTGAVLVDCLFGSGLSRGLPHTLHAMLVALAAAHGQRVAIDVPSGIDADSGALGNPGLPDYDLTLALGAWKHAHFAMPAAALMGTLRLVPIGIAAQHDAARVLPRARIAPPAADAHKYRRGLVGLAGGAMPGAIVLAARAAMRAGAGYVRVVAPHEPGALPPDCVWTADPAALDDPRVAAVLVGPGLGRDAAGCATLARVLAGRAATVVDADALMLLRPGQGTPAILTPHDGELCALEAAFGLAGTGLKRDRALALARASGAVVIAKGPDSVIAASDGRLVVAPRASSWLSVAGSGDVLAGLVASRLAVLRDPWRAACEGLWLHGEAARLAGSAFSAGMLADRVGDALGAAL